MIKFDMVDGPAGFALGSIDGIVAEMKTNRYVSDITDEVADYAEKEIRKQIDLLANSGAANIEHAYEFKKNDLFIPTDRLWTTIRHGEGSRQAITWEFLPSRRGGPSIKDRIDRGELEVRASDKVFKPGKRSGNKVDINRREIFYNKAAMLEFGGIARITPFNKKIFVPFRKGQAYSDRPYAFLKGSTVTFERQRHLGAFSAAYMIAAEIAGQKSEQYVQMKVDEDVAKVEKGIRRARAKQTKSFGIAFSDGSEQARRVMHT